MSITYDFDDPKYLDEQDVREELDRVYDLCHGCRLCWNLCPSFASLFDLIDEKTDGLDVGLSAEDQDRVVDECFQCKLCYIKCPYTPPHEWQLDFPKLMLRALATRTGGKPKSLGHRVLAATDFAGTMAVATHSIANASLTPDGVVRRSMESATGISASRLLPPYAKQRFTSWWKRQGGFEPTTPFEALSIPGGETAAPGGGSGARPSFLEPTEDEMAAAAAGPAMEPGGDVPSFLQPTDDELAAMGPEGAVPGPGAESAPQPVATTDRPPVSREVTIFPTCIIEYQTPEAGKATSRVLKHNGCDVDCASGARCCGMPSLDGGDLDGFLKRASHNVRELLPAVRAGRKVIAAQATCKYVLSRDYPEYLKTPEAREVADAVMDPAQYLAELRRVEGIREDFVHSLGSVAYHAACHLRAQEQGYKARDLLALVPDTQVRVVESCSGIDGTWGYRAENQEMAKAIIAPTAEAFRNADPDVIVGDCHLSNVALEEEGLPLPVHPMQALARAYGIDEQESR